MKIGDSVRVKKGIVNPDYERMDIGGWEGRITKIDEAMIDFDFDSITLQQLSPEYIINCVVEGYSYTSFILEKDELEIVPSRDTIKDVEEIQNKLSEEFEELGIGRIKKILQSEELELNHRNLELLEKEITKKLPKNFLLTGATPFAWEETYFFYEMNEKEYNTTRLNTASYKDSFKFIHIHSDRELVYGLYVKIKRTSDNKQFVIPLCDLKSEDENSPFTQMLEDYSSWISNFG